MSAPATDHRDHWNAVEALLTASLGPDRVFKYGEVPGLDGNAGTLPPIFAILSITRRYVRPAKSSRRAESSGWRATVLHAGRTVDEAAWALLRVTDALEGVRLVVDGHTSTPAVLDASGRSIAKDGSRMSGSVAFTYAI